LASTFSLNFNSSIPIPIQTHDKKDSESESISNKNSIDPSISKDSNKNILLNSLNFKSDFKILDENTHKKGSLSIPSALAISVLKKKTKRFSRHNNISPLNSKTNKMHK
jgi:hypothetical protein